MPELQGNLRHFHDGDGILAVHVENRRFDHLRDLGAILARPRIGGQRGEADLVVDDEVDRASGAVAGELRHVENLRDHALTDETPRRRG